MLLGGSSFGWLLLKWNLVTFGLWRSGSLFYTVQVQHLNKDRIDHRLRPRVGFQIRIVMETRSRCWNVALLKRSRLNPDRSGTVSLSVAASCFWARAFKKKKKKTRINTLGVFIEETGFAGSYRKGYQGTGCPASSAGFLALTHWNNEMIPFGTEISIKSLDKWVGQRGQMTM